MNYNDKVFSLDERLKSNFLWFAEHFLPTVLFKMFFKKIKQIHCEKLLRKLKLRGEGKTYKVDRVKSITPEDFYKNYYKKNKPLVIEGICNSWPCMEWDFDFFKENYGDEETMVTDHGEMHIQKLSHIIDELRTQGIKKARVCNVIQNNQELMEKVDLGLLHSLIPKPSFTTSFQFFLGTGGNSTPLHAGLTNNFSLQLHGTKIWKLVPPKFNPIIRPIVDGGPLLKSAVSLDPSDREVFEETKYIDIVEAELNPGDILFNPSFYWHHIFYSSENLTIGLRWLNVYSMLKSSIVMTSLVGFAYNPLALKSFFTIKKGKAMPFYH